MRQGFRVPRNQRVVSIAYTDKLWGRCHIVRLPRGIWNFGIATVAAGFKMLHGEMFVNDRRCFKEMPGFHSFQVDTGVIIKIANPKPCIFLHKPAEIRQQRPKKVAKKGGRKSHNVK